MEFKSLSVIIVLGFFTSTYGLGYSQPDFKFENLKSNSSDETQEAAVRQLIHRLIPSKESRIIIKVNSSLTSNLKDIFQIQVKEDVLYILGNSGVAVAWGLNHYLKTYCHVQVLSWTGVQLANLPSKWPEVNLTIEAIDRFRYYFNVCTESYSMVWWDWSRWQQEIDWMALNAINLPLAFTGQEYTYLQTLMEFGLNKTEIQAYFPGPAFLAWGRMGNLQAWAGPLTDNWIEQQRMLQIKILERMRDFGMIPVLPGFNGHVPIQLKKIYPNADIYRMAKWGHFQDPRYSGVDYIDPTDPLYTNVSQAYIRNLIKEFGSSHIYNIDLFNEMPPKSSLPQYLGNVSRAVYEALKNVDDKAIWLTQGWMFFSDPSFWQVPQVKAFVSSVPLGKLIILDLTAEAYPQYTRFESFYGQPFIWCMLNNYGGVSGMFGDLSSISNGPIKARSFPNVSMIGTGMAPEGIGKNYVVYDLMTEMAWRNQTTDLSNWVDDYSLRRYGVSDQCLTQAWSLLKDSVYKTPLGMRNHGKYILVVRPSLSRTATIWYETKKVFDAWKHLNEFTERSNTSHLSETFGYDLVDVARQSLQIIFVTKYEQLISSYKNKDTGTLRNCSGEIVELLGDLDDILKTNKNFLLGAWIADAKNLARNSQEESQYEMNARNQVTIWGPNGEELDYAIKQWSGIVKDYFLPRWKLFGDVLLSSLESGKHFNRTYFNNKVFKTVEQPFSYSHKVYPKQPEGSTVETSRKLYKKYSKIMKSSHIFIKE